MTPEQINYFILSNHWKVAKTMPRNPHEYCLKERCKDPKSFEDFVIHIRAHGYKQNFFQKTYIYYDVGEYQYWTMGAPLQDTILINRAKKVL